MTTSPPTQLKSTNQTPAIDSRLIESIHEGNCVAFVGAGFSAAAGLPSWRDLLRSIADAMPKGTDGAELGLVDSLLNRTTAPSSRELEMAAQILHDLDRERFRARLDQALRRDPLPEAMQLRLKHLRGIPFRAIVTTNFDPLLPGMPPEPEAYRRLLRSRRPSPWRDAIARVALGQPPVVGTASDADSLVVQLHGRLDEAGSLVLTRSQYRKRLYADPAYLTVLRSLLATSTVLFLGYSLTDAYLNELRSELVEAFSNDEETAGRKLSRAGGPGGWGAFPHGAPAGDPLAWAVLEDVSDVACSYYERYEGLGVIPYATRDGAGGAHGGFDEILKAIYDRTNPIHRLGELLAGRSVLWFDPNPEHNNRGRKLLDAAAHESGGDAHSTKLRFLEETTLDTTWSLLSQPGNFNLVISHWGHGMYAPGIANGEELLRRAARLRADGIAVPPIVIFAGGGFEATNRRRALELGAAEFVSRWEDLITVLERVLGETASSR